MINKRGISPLIATMLLVALAVAIGVSFVSYAGVYFNSKSTNKSQCAEYSVDFFLRDNSKPQCARFGSAYLLKFWDKDKPSSDSGCYLSTASGTSSICNAQNSLTDNTWATTSDTKIS